MIHRDFGRTWIRLEGQEDVSPIVFWDDDALPLLGAVILEIFGLGIDRVNSYMLSSPAAEDK